MYIQIYERSSAHHLTPARLLFRQLYRMNSRRANKSINHLSCSPVNIIKKRAMLLYFSPFFSVFFRVQRGVKDFVVSVILL